MPLRIYCDNSHIVVQAVKPHRQLLICFQTGAITQSSTRFHTPRDCVEFKCILGISRFPSKGHGYVIIALRATKVANSPFDQHSINRVDSILLVPIERELAKAVLARASAHAIVSTSGGQCDDSDSTQDEEDLYVTEDLDHRQANFKDNVMRTMLLREFQLPRIASVNAARLPSDHKHFGEQTEHARSSSLSSKFEGACRSLLEGHTYYSKSILLTNEDFTFNRYISESMPEAFRVKLVQGFIGKTSFTLGNNERIHLILLSMRSCQRNGLRYQRRGIDKTGNVANFVETNQITWKAEQPDVILSFKQIRGSIPLHWKQESWSLQPVPVLSASKQAAEASLQKHYLRLESHYGHVFSVSLVEQEGREGIVGREFTDVMHSVDRKILNFEFHRETAGMKYENIASLISALKSTLEDAAWTQTFLNDITLADEKQTGIIRTNCMDCLDRTNVVQSAIARHILNLQYGERTNTWSAACQTQFQGIWADHGDAIAQQYTSSPALKGDFTRTGKRELVGVLNDARNSLRRLYTNCVADFFGQLVIDHMLGVVGEEAVTRFEASLCCEELDDFVAKREQQARAMELCQSILLGRADMDRPIPDALLGAWTYLTPRDRTDLLSELQETQIILTSAALYVCRFDYSLQRIAHYESISLQDIARIRTGAYVTSTVHSSFKSPELNHGIMIVWQEPSCADRSEIVSMERMVAFKATPTLIPGQERAFAEETVRELSRAVRASGRSDVFIEQAAIVSAAEVQGSLSSTWSMIGHRVQSMIWG